MANQVDRRAISPEMQELREAVLELTHNQLTVDPTSLRHRFMQLSNSHGEVALNS